MRTLCFHCAVPLARDDREHYGYQCHACAIREHELILTLKRDPDHPDATAFSSPIDLGMRIDDGGEMELPSFTGDSRLRA